MNQELKSRDISNLVDAWLRAEVLNCYAPCFSRVRPHIQQLTALGAEMPQLAFIAAAGILSTDPHLSVSNRRQHTEDFRNGRAALVSTLARLAPKFA